MKTRNPSHEVKRVSEFSPEHPHRPRGSKTIVAPFVQASYVEIVHDKNKFKEHINAHYEKHPDLFPEALKDGYQLDGFTEPSKKLGVMQRRIVITTTGEVYSIRPSFVMPYMTGYVKDIGKAILLAKYAVPFWVIAWIFGKDPTFWWRIFASLGRNSLVGTTIKDKEKIPKDIVADEKVTWMGGEEINIATTVGKECLLGVALCTDRSEQGLEDGYKVFKEEAQNIDPNYAPDSVNTDGSIALRNAFKLLFPKIIIILCYLHSVLKIKERSKRLGTLFKDIMDRVWHVYHAETKRAFSQRMRRLKEWAILHVQTPAVLEKILRLCGNSKLFQYFYDHKHAHRTSNMIDRLMNRQDRFLYIMNYFHGHFLSAELEIRAWALLMNFGPYCPHATATKDDWICAAQKINGFRYSDDWLENLLISSSMNGYRQ